MHLCGLCAPLISPISPQHSLGHTLADQGWDRLEDATILNEQGVNITKAVADEDIEAGGGDAYFKPKGMPEPCMPCRADVDLHNLTHLPYRSWCKQCVAARRDAEPQKLQNSSATRCLALIEFDYCFPRSSADDKFVTVLIARPYPCKSLFSVACDHKSVDPYGTQRLSVVIGESGYQHIVYKSDQESSIITMFEDALQLDGETGEPCDHDDPLVMQAVPEHSAVGASPCNGRAERAVQAFEDLLRC